jgi:alpha-galactosidase
MRLWILAVLLPLIYSLNNGVGLKPPMGWNTWYKFFCQINETLVKEATDALVYTGLKDLGYQYVNLDDCWQLSRDNKTGEIQADPQAFPSGIPALADYVHSKGLKFGLYSDAGEKTCQGRPGGLNYEDIDAQTYAKWNVDFLKYDNCYNDDIDPLVRYPKMRDALNKTGKPIFYSICNWGEKDPWIWGPQVGNSWRTTGDLSDRWSDILKVLEAQANISGVGRPGGWNDPDMLQAGNGGMTSVEYATQFAFWAFLKAPLIIGCDVRNMTVETFSILTNKEIIAVNQDDLGLPIIRFSVDEGREIWGGPVTDGFVGILFNRADLASTIITCNFNTFALTGMWNVRDLTKHKDLGVFQNSFSQTVDPHGVFVFKLTPYKAAEEKTFMPIIV